MPLRFFIPAPPTVASGDLLSLDREQTHYVSRVLRKKPGATLTCFDGAGLAFTAELAAATSRQAEIRVLNLTPRTPAPAPDLHAALALLKGAAMDRAIQAAVELGATAISLIKTARSEADWKDAKRADNKMIHWQKVVVGACEQSGQLHLPPLHPMRSLSDALTAAANQALVYDASGEPMPTHLPEAPRTVFIGPEGGWDEGELAAFKTAGIPVYRLGSNTLRAETMPGVALALLQQAQGWR